MLKFTTSAPKVIQDIYQRPGAKDYFFMFDTPRELADFAKTCGGRVNAHSPDQWAGNVTGLQAVKMAQEGDLSGVASSDAMLEKFERFTFETGRKAWSNDVCGSIPNVPAYVAGHPLAMRRRTRQDSAAAPIAVVVDLTTSGSITAEQIAKRGAAILALVRILSTRRPVELWAGTGLDADGRKNSVWTFAKIETAPLDLATAAHVLTHASFPRILCYEISRQHHGYTGGWPYGAGPKMQFRPHLSAIVAPAFTHTAQTLCLPPLFMADESVNYPEKWIEARLSELSPVDLAATHGA